jgi:hypothetical protein
MKIKRHRLFAGMAAALALGFAATAANAAGVFTLESKTFQDGKVMPKKVARTYRRNCTGRTCRMAPRASFC